MLSQTSAHTPCGSVVADPLMRPEVLRCQREADDLRGRGDEAFELAMFWASLVTTCCDGVATCDHPLCYEAWRQYQA